MPDPKRKPVSIQEVVAEVAASLRLVASENVVRANLARQEAERQAHRRAELIEPWRSFVTDEDFRRIVRNEPDTKAARAVRAFVSAASNPRARFLWLTGARGVGKTVAALWAISEVGGLCASAEEVRRAYLQEHAEAQELRPRLERCGLLVVDDVGTAKDEADEERALFELLNRRQGARQTILTGNLSRSDVSRRFGGRVLDRVFHSGRVVDCGAKSLRRGAGGA